MVDTSLMIIENAMPENYPEMLDVWEDSVRATHDFITEEDIEFFKPNIIEQVLPAVILKCVKDDKGKIQGFIGVHDAKVEMLFVLNKARGKGIGKLLLEFAMNRLNADSVDVNEQNPDAVNFYMHMGFKVTSRSPLDDMGKPSYSRRLHDNIHSRCVNGLIIFTEKENPQLLSPEKNHYIHP